jgi:signal transduction histidine kinase
VSDNDIARLISEHEALRRIAMLVARGTPAAELFAAATEEVGKVLEVEVAHLNRYESDGSVTVVAAWSDAGQHLPPVGSRWIVGGDNLTTRILHTGRPARVDSYADATGPTGVAAREAGHRSAVATPIVVAGQLWGAMAVVSLGEQPLPAETEARLADFTDLLATAIASAETRADIARLADEQSALRRVATLVARGAPAQDLFGAVTAEVGHLLAVDFAGLGKYGSDCTVMFVANWSRPGAPGLPTSTSIGLGGHNLTTLVADTRRPARLDADHDKSGPIGELVSGLGVRSGVATPIIVEDRLWGVIVAGSTSQQPLPPDTEARLAAFTDLVATAIANAESRAELAASRARIVAAADDARRRIERDLHDGAQQRLVALGLELRAAQASIPAGLDQLGAELARIADGLARVQSGLRQIARGIHPAILAHGGLGPVLKTLARTSPLPVEVDVRCLERLPEQVEVAAYYVVSEALTNAAKHANASVVHVEVQAPDSALWLRVTDDGSGGADPARGSGLVGLKDRVETLGGTISIYSQRGAGTSLEVEIPLRS